MLLGEKLEGGRRIDPSNGLIMPWYTSPCLEWLVTMDFRRKRIFEFGAGDSTHWYRTKGAIVEGVESEISWADKAKVKHEAYYPDYIESICYHVMRDGFFDIVVIDGIWRDECTEFSLPALKPGGFLIIDNWKQKSADLEHWPLTEKLIE